MRVPYPAPLMAGLAPLVLLTACVGPGAASPGGKHVDTDVSEDTALPEDTASPPPATAHTWGASFAAAELSVGSCGTDDGGIHVVAPGPDLDGDGLGEVAIGVAGHDGAALGSGAVYLLAGSAAAVGARTWDAATIVTPAADAGGGFGARVMWVGDRDGDGVDDLLVGDNNYRLWTVSGADLRAGGEVTPRAAVVSDPVQLTRWADVDGDGRADWLFAFIRGGRGDGSGPGAVSVVRDTDFTLDGITRGVTAYGDRENANAGLSIAALDGDRDGDGLPEFALTHFDDVVVISSAAFLAGVDVLVDAALSSATWLSGHQVLAPGDADGDGLDELLVFDAANKLCVLNGADADGSERICIRDEGLGPEAGAVLGDDLDHDGVRDVWITRDGYLVAQDVGALARGIELELVRVPLPAPVSALAFGEGRVWASPTVVTDGGVADVAYGYTASLSPQRAATITGGAWGGIPGTPVWRDVSGDGVGDLVLAGYTGVGLVGFDGTTLAAGGRLTWCDATWSRAWSATRTSWIDDQDGDGADDALVLTEADDGTWLHEVWPGPAAIGLADGEPLASWTDDEATAPLVGCDLDGDGHDELQVPTGIGSLILGGVLGPDGAFPILGGLQGSGTLTCVPDLDGDGGAELLLGARGVYRVYLSALLDPDVFVREDEALLTLSGGWFVSPARLADTHGNALLGAWRPAEGGYQFCVVDLSGLSGNLSTEDVPTACLAGRVSNVSQASAWLDAAVGGGAPDLVLFNSTGDHSVQAVDGASYAVSPLVAAPEVAPARVGPGADVLGAGARAIWALTEEATLADRYRLDVLYAHPPDSEASTTP